VLLPIRLSLIMAMQQILETVIRRVSVAKHTQAFSCAAVRLQQVILEDLILCDESEDSRLPNTCNKTQARNKGAQKISEQDHGRLLDEITRMEMLEFVEDEDDIMDYSGSEGEQSIDEGEQSMDDDDDDDDDDGDQ
jgi:hypothetical protein